LKMGLEKIKNDLAHSAKPTVWETKKVGGGDQVRSFHQEQNQFVQIP
jgi:hypothetical protein